LTTRNGYSTFERILALNVSRSLTKPLTLRSVVETFKTIQMVDVHLPTTDGRELVLSRYTQSEPNHRMLLDTLRLRLPEQPPSKITPAQV
jgi:hypothetical protein